MSSEVIGLVDPGSRDWLAGHIYIKSLVYANSLLPDDQRLEICLFYKGNSFSVNDYKDIHTLVKKIVAFEGLSEPIPEVSDNTLLTQLRKNECRVIFPSPFTHKPEFDYPRTISWIPDFQHLYYPQFFSEKEIAIRESHYAMLFENSDIVVVSNEFSKKDAINFSSLAEKKVRVLPLTFWLGKDWSRPECGEIIKNFQLPDKYLMFPAQFWLHKNHRMLFEVIAKLTQKGLKEIMLVCSGSTDDYRHPAYHGELMNFVGDNKLQNNIKILGLIPREDQVQLMRGAAAIIQPSLFEGWSALLEEARALGKQVFASDIPMHREQNPDHCTFFNPTDPDDLANCLLNAWPNLKPGADASEEREAEIKYQDHLYRFGKAFRNICVTTL